MFSATIIGIDRRVSSSASRSDRRRLVASSTQTISSGGVSPRSRPVTTSRVIASSSVVGTRL